jgi:hypothetical protein
LAFCDVDFDLDQLRFKPDNGATHHFSQHSRLLLDMVLNHPKLWHDLARSSVIISRMAIGLKCYWFLNLFCKREHIAEDIKKLSYSLQATNTPSSFTAQQAAKRPPLGGLAVF